MLIMNVQQTIRQIDNMASHVRGSMTFKNLSYLNRQTIYMKCSQIIDFDSYKSFIFLESQ